MKIIDSLKNFFLYNNKYRTHSEAVIISCYFNPQRNPYRLKAFTKFYESIKHLNHEIVECVIEGTEPELIGKFPNIKRVDTKNLLWHKESLLNMLISKLDKKYKYVFWIDADVIFTNQNWLVDGVKELQKNRIIQPFEYCVHLEEHENEPSFDIDAERKYASVPKIRHPRLWRSFSANHQSNISGDTNYDKHGHVGFAWGARRELLDSMPLYDKALVGGADHIMAHAAAGQIGHSCITKSFTDNIDEVNEWSDAFYSHVRGKIGYVKGDLYHIWHGTLESRQYLKRIQDFTPISKNITQKDENGLFITDDDSYVREYFDHREKTNTTDILHESFKVIENTNKKIERREQLRNMYPNADDSFIESMMLGYLTDSTLMGTAMGGNMLGAMIGDSLNGTDEFSGGELPNNVEFGGGDFGGAGAGGTWEPSNDNNSDNDITESDNFS